MMEYLDVNSLFDGMQYLFLGVVTLTFGHKKPVVGDIGDPIFDALEDNIVLDDAHTHNGSNSDRVVSGNLTRGSVSVSNSGWSASGSLYKKTVTFPSGWSAANGSDWGSASIRFYFASGTYANQECFPKTNYLSATTFELFSLVSNQDFTVKFV